jgi:hypothetical protein
MVRAFLGHTRAVGWDLAPSASTECQLRLQAVPSPRYTPVSAVPSPHFAPVRAIPGPRPTPTPPLPAPARLLRRRRAL